MKAATNHYYSTVLGGHPRHTIYNDLNAAGIARGVPSLQAQLNRDVAGVIPSPIVDVTNELWQVIADAWGIELIVVFNDVIVGRRKMVVARGDHNARQLFLLLEADGEYRPLIPAVSDSSGWRYMEHMPAKLKRKRPTVQDFVTSAEYRSPIYQLDARGYRLTPTAPIMNQQTGAPRMNAFQGGLYVPEHVIDEPNPAATSDAHIGAYLNTGEWM
jgi:hypothetical protein